MTLLINTILLGLLLLCAGIGLAVAVSVCCTGVDEAPDPWEED